MANSRSERWKHTNVLITTHVDGDDTLTFDCPTCRKPVDITEYGEFSGIDGTVYFSMFAHCKHCDEFWTHQEIEDILYNDKS